MSLNADKKRFDSLRADLTKKSEALLAYEIELGRKYGHNFQTQWLSAGQKKKFEKLREAKDKVGEKIYELVARVSPRQWDRDVPAWWVREKLTWEDAIRPKDEPLSVVVPGSYGVPDGTVKETARKTGKGTTEKAERAGEQYAQDQLQSDYFADWIREQLYEAGKMDPNDVLPLETKADATVIAWNMLQQLEWDAKRDLRGRDILELLGPEAAARPGDSEPRPALVATFFDGFRKTLDASQEWLSDELLQIKGEMSGGRVGETRRSPSGRTPYGPARIRWEPSGGGTGWRGTGATGRTYLLRRAGSLPGDKRHSIQQWNLHIEGKQYGPFTSLDGAKNEAEHRERRTPVREAYEPHRPKAKRSARRRR
jgi:hypothetical protein